MQIKIDYSRDKLLSQQGLELLQKHYMKPEDSSPQDAFARACLYYGSNEEHAQRLYDAVSKLHFMFASPVLSNCSPDDRGLPISCFLSFVPDTLEGLIGHEVETKWLSVFGGGVGGHWGSIRCVSSKSPGPIPFIHSVDGALTAYKQGETRKGAYAAYMDVSHPDIREFIQIRVPGGDINRKSTNIHNAINLSDEFMVAVYNNSDWDLIDPKTGDTKSVVKARELWELILITRHRTGEPYLNFIDTANKAIHPAHTFLGKKLKGSNLCNEIHLLTDEQRTAVCCLSSLNLELIDDWDELLVRDLVEMLDNVLEVFISKAPDSISKAKYSAQRSRDIGLGAMGWHGLLMKRGIEFESNTAIALTASIFSYIKQEAQRATSKLATDRGSCPDAVDAGYKCRNLNLLAIAPNANNSIMANCTASIEPIHSNAFAHRTRIGTHLTKNKYLQQLLDTKIPHKTLELMGMTSEQWLNKQWEIVIRDEGSVKSLACLNEHEKNVFKTFKEINMESVIKQAAKRQMFLCQGQSVNIYAAPDASKGYLNYIHFMAWELGLKGLYYLRTGSVIKADKVSDAIIREAIGDAEECQACHG